MEVRKEPIVSACLVLLFFIMSALVPQSVATAGMTVGVLLTARALYVYWRLLDRVIRQDPENSMDSDITGLYVLVRFYKRHGWPALMATLGNITLAGLIFMGSLISATR